MKTSSKIIIKTMSIENPINLSIINGVIMKKLLIISNNESIMKTANINITYECPIKTLVT